MNAFADTRCTKLFLLLFYFCLLFFIFFEAGCSICTDWAYICWFETYTLYTQYSYLHTYLYTYYSPIHVHTCIAVTLRPAFMYVHTYNEYGNESRRSFSHSTKFNDCNRIVSARSATLWYHQIQIISYLILIDLKRLWFKSKQKAKRNDKLQFFNSK